jgi:hypothetical protein
MDWGVVWLEVEEGVVAFDAHLMEKNNRLLAMDPSCWQGYIVLELISSGLG